MARTATKGGTIDAGDLTYNTHRVKRSPRPNAQRTRVAAGFGNQDKDRRELRCVGLQGMKLRLSAPLHQEHCRRLLVIKQATRGGRR
jgi:hypothetical protein